MSNRLDEFQSYRTRMNDRIAEIDHFGIKRFFNLDSMAYKGRTKRQGEGIAWPGGLDGAALQRLY